MSKLTHEQIEELLDLRSVGHSYEWIARRLGGVVTASTVSWHCLRAGVDVPKPRVLSATIVGPAVMQRGDHVVRRFTADDDARLLALESEGLSFCEIARRMKRKPNSVRARLLTLARHDARREAAA